MIILKYCLNLKGADREMEAEREREKTFLAALCWIELVTCINKMVAVDNRT